MGACRYEMKTWKCFTHDKRLLNILMMGCLFLIVGTSWISTQVNSHVAYTSLALFYCCMALGAIFAPVLLDKVGESVAYSAFIAVYTRIIPELLYVTAAVSGLLVSLFWVSSGTYLNKITNDENRQTHTAIFVSFIAAAHFAGNGFAFLIQQAPKFHFYILFAGFAGVCFLSGLLFLLLRKAPKIEQPDRPPETVQGRFKQLGLVIIDTEMLYLWPIIIAYGFNMSVVFGYFPAKVNDTQWSSLSLTLMGAVHIIVSLSGSKLAHLLKGTMMITMTSVALLAGVFLGAFANEDRRWMYLLAGACFGFTESGFLVQIFLIFGTTFRDRLNEVNSAFRFVNGVATAFLFFIAPILNYERIVYIATITQGVGVSVLYFRAWKKRKDDLVFPVSTGVQKGTKHALEDKTIHVEVQSFNGPLVPAVPLPGSESIPDLLALQQPTPPGTATLPPPPTSIIIGDREEPYDIGPRPIARPPTQLMADENEFIGGSLPDDSDSDDDPNSPQPTSRTDTTDTAIASSAPVLISNEGSQTDLLHNMDDERPDSSHSKLPTVPIHTPPTARKSEHSTQPAQTNFKLPKLGSSNKLLEVPVPVPAPAPAPPPKKKKRKTSKRKLNLESVPSQTKLTDLE